MLHFHGWPGTHYEGPKLPAILLPLPPHSWNYRQEPAGSGMLISFKTSMVSGWRVTGYHGVWRLPILLQCSGRSLLAPGPESSLSMEALPSLLSQSEKTLKWGSFTPGCWGRSQVSAGPSRTCPMREGGALYLPDST